MVLKKIFFQLVINPFCNSCGMEAHSSNAYFLQFWELLLTSRSLSLYVVGTTLLCVFVALDFPAPLATKIYYSQRTNRLRAAIRHLYFQDLSGELCTDVGPKTSHGEMVSLHDSSHRDPSFEQMDNVLNKEVCKSLILLIKANLYCSV